MREKAQRTVDASNLREIAKAAMIYASDNNDRLPDPAALQQQGLLTAPSAAYLWAAILARNGMLSDPTFYFAKNDPLFNGTYPDAIIAKTDATRSTLDATDTANAALSWEFVGGLKMGDPATTPIAFTRALTANGTWDAARVYATASGGLGTPDGTPAETGP